MAKKKECVNCHCERIITITARVTFASHEMTLNFKRMCFPCLLRAVNLHTENGKYDYEKAMTCLE